jgi:hypothetical protein
MILVTKSLRIMEKTWKLRVGEATNIRKRLEFLLRIENLRLGIRCLRGIGMLTIGPPLTKPLIQDSTPLLPQSRIYPF